MKALAFLYYNKDRWRSICPALSVVLRSSVALVLVYITNSASGHHRALSQPQKVNLSQQGRRKGMENHVGLFGIRTRSKQTLIDAPHPIFIRNVHVPLRFTRTTSWCPSFYGEFSEYASKCTARGRPAGSYWIWISGISAVPETMCFSSLTLLVSWRRKARIRVVALAYTASTHPLPQTTSKHIRPAGRKFPGSQCNSC